MAYETTAPRVKGSRTPKPKKLRFQFFVGLVLGIFALDVINASADLIDLVTR
jgi:hypothetical protein